MQLHSNPVRTEPGPEPIPLSMHSDSMHSKADPGAEPIDVAPAASSTGILIVGETRRADRVRASLGNRSVRSGLASADTTCVVSVDAAMRCLAERDFEVIILIAPVRGVTIERALATLSALDHSDSAGIRIVLVPDSFAEKRARNLYLQGARAVFAWPDDIVLLPTLIDKTLDRHATQSERSREPLETVVRDRLDAQQRHLSHRIGVHLANGTAQLSGRVSSLWAKISLARRTRLSPGVEAVDAGSLEVERSDRSDSSIGREIRALLDGTSTVDTSTIGVSVHDGRVVLLGLVLDQERSHVIDLISMVPGVRSVDDQSLSSSIQKSRARALAARMQGALRRTKAGRNLRVAVVGKIAVLRGVGTRDEIDESRRILERWVRRSGPVRKVLERAGPRLHRI